MEEDVENKDEKIVFFTSKSQLARIEDFRFSHRLSSRAEAVRKLIEIAFIAMDEKKKTSHLSERRERQLISPTISDHLKVAEEQEPYMPNGKSSRRGKKK
ncbi:MAG: hypothetical protein HQL06_13995 [Nitrospirae bacterium]|nr:hypothetical protein [Nitrospirota bacterium]